VDRGENNHRQPPEGWKSHYLFHASELRHTPTRVMRGL
jgi:hypothetical protein